MSRASWFINPIYQEPSEIELQTKLSHLGGPTLYLRNNIKNKMDFPKNNDRNIEI